MRFSIVWICSLFFVWVIGVQPLGCGGPTPTESTHDASSNEHHSDHTSTTETDNVSDQACESGATRACYTGPASTRDKGICKSGLAICKDGVWSSCTKEILPESKDGCDKKDNDCDGDIDEDCTCEEGAIQACYPHSKGCTQSNDSFQCTVPCKAGQQTCINNTWGSCTGAVGPQKETCDGKDNDCDGKVDNGLTPPPCAKTKGVCKGKTQSCDGQNGWKACDASTYGKDYQSKETACDQKDNDCDGKVDNLAIQETCDGKDNDCDGKVDNGIKAALCPKQKGVCKGKAQICEGTNGWKSCDASTYGKDYQSKETACDQKDNDCDGTIDLQCTDTLAGLSGTSGSTDHPTDPTQARFDTPEAIAFHQNKLYIADTENDTIRIMDLQKKSVTTLSIPGMSKPKGIVVQSSGVIYVSSSKNHTILKIDPVTSKTTVFGKSGTSGSADGTASQARFNAPQGLALDASGQLYVADTKNHTIRKIDLQGNVTTFAGQANRSGKLDHTTDPKKALFKFPEALAVHSQTLYVVDTRNNSIRTITLTQRSTSTRSITATLDEPKGIAVDAKGTLYVSDSNNNLIRAFGPNQVERIVAGQKIAGKKDEWANKASFNGPQGLALDTSASWLYIVDTDNHSIRRIKLK